MYFQYLDKSSALMTSSLRWDLLGRFLNNLKRDSVRKSCHLANTEKILHELRTWAAK